MAVEYVLIGAVVLQRIVEVIIAQKKCELD